MVLSAVFWPAFREEKLKVPEDVQRYSDVLYFGQLSILFQSLIFIEN